MGLNYANGKYIGFLNSDDFYKDKSVLESISKEIILKKTDVIFSNIKIIDRNSTELYGYKIQRTSDPFYYGLELHRLIQHFIVHEKYIKRLVNIPQAIKFQPILK